MEFFKREHRVMFGSILPQHPARQPLPAAQLSLDFSSKQGHCSLPVIFISASLLIFLGRHYDFFGKGWMHAQICPLGTHS